MVRTRRRRDGARRVTRGDPIDPGRQPRFAPEVRQAAIHRDEHFLTGVLALFGRHAERRQEPVNDGRVAVVKGAPGDPVALPAARQDVDSPARRLSLSGPIAKCRGCSLALHCP